MAICVIIMVIYIGGWRYEYFYRQTIFIIEKE